MPKFIDTPYTANNVDLSIRLCPVTLYFKGLVGSITYTLDLCFFLPVGYAETQYQAWDIQDLNQLMSRVYQRFGALTVPCAGTVTISSGGVYTVDRLQVTYDGSLSKLFSISWGNQTKACYTSSNTTAESTLGIIYTDAKTDKPLFTIQQI